jgi:hypothetical protein
MSEYKFEVDNLVLWLGSIKMHLEGSGIALIGIEENRSHLPSAFADFDSDSSSGRIRCWVNGQFDFEVQYLQDEKPLFYRHLDVLSLDSPVLANTLNEFLKALQASS